MNDVEEDDSDYKDPTPFVEEFEDLIRHVDERATTENRRKTIKTLADDSFKDHEITQESEQIFYCGKPGTRMYSFRVCFLPEGMIVVYGDIGEMMVQRGSYDWLKGAIRHDYISDYIFEKVRPVRSWRDKEFQEGDALEEIKKTFYGQHSDDPQPELALKIAHDWLGYDCSGCDADAWGRANYDHTGDFEYPDCRDYNANDLWCYHALSWFVRKREAS